MDLIMQMEVYEWGTKQIIKTGNIVWPLNFEIKATYWEINICRYKSLCHGIFTWVFMLEWIVNNNNNSK